MLLMEQIPSAKDYFGLKVYRCSSQRCFGARFRIHSLNLKSIEVWKAFTSLRVAFSSSSPLERHWVPCSTRAVQEEQVLCRGLRSHCQCHLLSPRDLPSAGSSGTAHMQKQSTFAGTCFLHLCSLPSIFHWIVGTPHHREVLLPCSHPPTI